MSASPPSSRSPGAGGRAPTRTPPSPFCTTSTTGSRCDHGARSRERGRRILRLGAEKTSSEALASVSAA